MPVCVRYPQGLRRGRLGTSWSTCEYIWGSTWMDMTSMMVLETPIFREHMNFKSIFCTNVHYISCLIFTKLLSLHYAIAQAWHWFIASLFWILYTPTHYTSFIIPFNSVPTYFQSKMYIFEFIISEFFSYIRVIRMKMLDVSYH